MNYNFIYDDDTGKYLDIFSEKGETLINYLSSFLKKKKRKHVFDSEYIDTHSFDLQFTTIENYKHRSELRRTSNYFRNALEAYYKIKIFDFFEDDTRYDVSLAIENYINLDFQY